MGDNEDQGRSFAELCERAGFQFEEHAVVTHDGYILALYRIPGLLSEAKEDLASETTLDGSGGFAAARRKEKPAVYF